MRTSSRHVPPESPFHEPPTCVGPGVGLYPPFSVTLTRGRGGSERVNEKVGAELRSQVRGEVIESGGARYDEARTVDNAMIDRRPAFVVRCTGVADVIAAVKAARAGGLNVAIRGGGPSGPGFGTADDAVVLDLGRMKGIRVDPAAKTVRAEGGCTWGDFNHATYAFGLATTGGIISTTGVAGLTLGGGVGYLGTATERANAGLCWALRGGGGTFGVVTNFEFRLHPVRDIVGGPMFFEVEDAPDVIRAYDAYITKAPRSLGAFFAWQIAPPLPFIPEDRPRGTLCGPLAPRGGAARPAPRPPPGRP